MRRVVISLGSALAFLAVAAVAHAQPTITVSGKVVAIAADSITVSVDGKDMKFAIDSKTQVIAPGGSTKAAEAKAQGKGVTAADVLKEGQAVQVQYHEAGMHAASIRAIASVPGPKGPPSPPSLSATGVVSAVSGNSLTVKGASGDVTVTIDEKTSVIGPGLGTAGRKAATEGKKPVFADLVHEGDTVMVNYHEQGGTRLATQVRVTKPK